MHPTEDPLTPARLRVLQIVTVAMVMGALTFLAIALFIVLVQNQGRGMAPPAGLPLISLLAAGFLVGQALMSFVLPAAVARSTLRRIAAGTWKPAPGAEVPATDAGKLLALYQTVLIVGLALLEGACFFGGIAYLLEGPPFAAGVVVVGLLLMLARFPTESRVRHWLEDQKEQLAQARREIGTGGQVR
jgi:hypothetical protein